MAYYKNKANFAAILCFCTDGCPPKFVLALKYTMTSKSLNCLFAVAVWLSLMPMEGCYSFKGISIEPNVNTFFIQNFEVLASSAPPTLAVDFTERLKDKVRNETRLQLRSTEPDIEFSGKVTDFRVVPVAPQPGQTVALNRLEVAFEVLYTDHKNEAKTWSSGRRFQHFAEFSNDQDLLSIQDRLLRQIFDQVLEDIFNATFNDW